MPKTHRDLVVWQKAMQLARRVYELTKAFPREELYGLTSQIRCAAVSVPANIAEGAARVGPKEFLQFLSIARGSLAELDTLTQLAKDLGMATDTQCSELQEQSGELSGLLGGLIASLRRRAQAQSLPRH
jgi:four helix bundle protein